MSQIKVAVSPFYGGEDWTCDKTGITFKRDERGLSSYIVPTTVDLTNIRKAIRLNALLLLAGELPEEVEVVEAPVVEEPVVEVKAEVVEEAPVAKPAKKNKSNKK